MTGLALALLLTACTWEPIARSTQPQLLHAGPARLVRLLDSQGSYALFTSGTGDAMRYRILDSDTRESCELSANDQPVSEPLRAPNLRGDDVPEFLLPILRSTPGAPEGTLFELYYSTEKCLLRGPYGLAERGPDAIQLREDKRNVSIVVGSEKSLRLVDPWTEQQRPLAEKVRGYNQVQQLDSSNAPEAMWVMEGGKLTQRALDGTLLLSLGQAVTDFQQNLLQGALRVAYTDGGDLYEAKGPAFTPVLVANDACNPRYNGTLLDLHTPCSELQLVRFDLVTGEIKRFAPGVDRAFLQGELGFETVPADGPSRVFVTLGTARTELVPPPVNAISVLDKARIAGRTNDGRFGIWSLTDGFRAAYDGVGAIQTFRDQRTSRLLWLMLYKESEGLGTLAGFDQSELETTVLARQALPDQTVPAELVLADHVLVDGWKVYFTNTLPEPVVLTLEPPILKQADDSNSGTLNARLLSGDLGSRIDDAVSSSEIVFAPYPGILYGVLEGPRSGLWFAAL